MGMSGTSWIRALTRNRDAADDRAGQPVGGNTLMPRAVHGDGMAARRTRTAGTAQFPPTRTPLAREVRRPPAAAGTAVAKTVADSSAKTDSLRKGTEDMPQNTEMQGLAIRSHIFDFALLIGGAVATACVVAAVAMGLVLLLAQ